MHNEVHIIIDTYFVPEKGSVHNHHTAFFLFFCPKIVILLYVTA